MVRDLILAIVALLFAPSAWAAYWIIDFEGDPSGYEIHRGDEPVPLEKLMLLLPGDEVIVREVSGRLTIVDDKNQRLEIGVADNPYRVPESTEPHGLLENIRDWVSSWWSTRGSQTTTTVAAVSKDLLAPSILGAADDQLLIAGTRDLVVRWRGGLPPYDVRLSTAAGRAVAGRGGQEAAEAVLRGVVLTPGRYTLEVSAGGDRDSMVLTVVRAAELPETALEIMELPVPDVVREGHVALFLSTTERWRFEALQLAYRYGLESLVYTLEQSSLALEQEQTGN